MKKRTRIVTSVPTKELAERIVVSLAKVGKKATIRKRKYANGNVFYNVWKLDEKESN